MLFDVYMFRELESRCTHNIQNAVLVAEKENLDFIYKAYSETRESVAFTLSDTKTVIFPTFDKMDTPPIELKLINQHQALQYGQRVARSWYCLDRKWHNSEWKVSEKENQNHKYFEVEIVFSNKRISPKRAVRCAVRVNHFFTEIVDSAWDGDYKRTKFDVYELSDQKRRNNLQIKGAEKIETTQDFESLRKLMVNQGNAIAMTLANTQVVVFPVPDPVTSRYFTGKFHNKGLSRRFTETTLRIWYGLPENEWVMTNVSVSDLQSLISEGWYIDHREVTLIFREKGTGKTVACFAKVYWDYVEILELKELN